MIKHGPYPPAGVQFPVGDQPDGEGDRFQVLEGRGDVRTAGGDLVRMLIGILLLGSTKDPNFLSSGALSRNIPICMGYGTLDTVYNWETHANLFKQIKSVAPNYPIRFTLFDTGTHGTPNHMTDWRLVLDWMLG